MNPSAPFLSGLTTIGLILVAMAAVAAVEVAIPLHARGRWHRSHLGPNLALTFLTFGTNLFLNIVLVAVVVWLESHGFGLLRWLPLPPLLAASIAVAALDFSFYAAHRSWHTFPSLWRYHAVHHSDPALDVTTTIRQHPVESLLRYAAMGAMAVVVGPSPTAFAVYRVTSVLSGLLEHSNIRAPRWLDGLLSIVMTWPHMHKVHHSRAPEQTDTNYGQSVLALGPSLRHLHTIARGYAGGLRTRRTRRPGSPDNRRASCASLPGRQARRCNVDARDGPAYRGARRSGNARSAAAL